ncbi:MAG TPA: 5'/3'-nucleotidase SurE [Chthoniobacterales bacterium]
MIGNARGGIVNKRDAHGWKRIVSHQHGTLVPGHLQVGRIDDCVRILLMSTRILIANDDGIYSPGIAALARIASGFGTVRIVAPDVEQSSMGHAITASRPLRYRRTPIGEFDAYRVNGTPADCVALGLHNWEKVDLVLSGINLGSNLGHSCWHSGTLAAAKQAALFGSRGVALSTPATEDEPDFERLTPYVEKVLETLLGERDLPLVNVNFPADPKGIRWTRQAVQQYDGEIFPASDPYGRSVYWFTVKPLTNPEKGTDRWAVDNGWVSMTPLRLDLTDEPALARMGAKVDESDQAILVPA